MIGRRIGPYEVLAKLGEGGMGEVYKARDSRLGRDVAVKVLPSSVATDPDRRARFEREAKAVAALSHPNILAIFDFAIYDGLACAVTELLEGQTLRARLDEGPLPVRRAIDTAIQIARGLTAAHDKGIVHRDLKPENIFLLTDGHVRILDFGLAKADGQHGTNETVAATDPGTVMGTVGYMAPEQIRGQAVDGRADLFALGTILYEMVSARRAFARETAAETMTAILKEDPPELAATRADLPPALDGIVRHCLERNSADRFQSARDLVFSLQGISQATGSGAAAASASSSKPRARLVWHEVLAWAVALVFAVALGVTYQRSPTVAPAAVVRLQVTAPDQTNWAGPLGAPEGSNGGTISPDGTMLAFTASDASGKVLLWIRPLDSFAARPLAGTEGAAFPFWSPDSRSLGFFTTTRLKRIAADGGPAQTLSEVTGTPRGASWNDQGVIIFATSGAAIRRISTDGGSPADVPGMDSESAPSVGPQWPAFLPDGRHFLYYSTSAREVLVGSLDAPLRKRLMGSDSNAIFAAPGHLLFAREGSLLAQRFDVNGLALVGDARPIVERISWSMAPWNLAAFSASRTGVLTYRLGGGNRTQFAWLDRSGRVVETVGPPGEYLSPALSLDETRLAFTRRDDQPAGDIWTLDLARQATPSRFTFNSESELYPLWTADGSTIIHSSTRDGIIAKSLAMTGGAKQLSALANSMLIPSQVTADGQLLIFFGDFGTKTGFDIYSLPLSGTAKPTVVVQGPLSEAEPSLSPDGRWLAYATTETGNYEVFVQPMPTTGAKWQVSTGGGRQPQWRRDGKELFFVTNDRKFYAVDIRTNPSFESGTTRFLFDMPANTISVRNSYVPSKDGQRFLVNKLLDTAVPPINVVLNWSTTMR